MKINLRVNKDDFKKKLGVTNGKDADEEKIVADVLSQISQVHMTGAEIVGKVNALPIGPDFQIDKSHIKGLEDLVRRSATNKTIHRGGSKTFLDLEDTPNAYTSQSLKSVRVNAGETALEFYTPITPITDHALLSNLAWTSSGHTGTASTFAGFDGSGVAINRALLESDVNLNKISGATISTLDVLHDYTGSAISFTGGLFTDNGDGTIAVPAGSGQIRATDSDTAQLLQVSWSAVSSLSLTDNDTNYIYLEYNGGSPQIVATTTQRTDYNTNIYLGLVYREGTTISRYGAKRYFGGNHAQLISRRLQATDPFAWESGALISETGTRNFALTAGVFWEGVDRFTTPAFDSSVADTFTYYYRDGVGGYTAQTAQTQINNTQYDNGTGTLATLSNNRYTNAWVYLNSRGKVFVMFGRVNSSSISGADSASPPADVPEIISSTARLIGRIIIKKSASTFTQIDTAFSTQFSPASVTEHNTLSGLQGGAADEYYHLTSAEYTELGRPSFRRTFLFMGS